MNVRVIPRTALKGYLKLVRTPLDTAIGVLPGNGSGAKPTAQLVVDRADATVRTVAGTLLHDPVLREDGQRRRLAANERERGLRLRHQAEQTAEQADTRLQEREGRANQERRRARETADTRRRQAETRAQKKTQQAAKTERSSRPSRPRAKRSAHASRSWPPATRRSAWPTRRAGSRQRARPTAEDSEAIRAGQPARIARVVVAA
jgi:hypothetical protein